MDQDPWLSPGRPLEGMLIRSFRNNHLLDRQLVVAGELEIPLVVGRHPHHRPGAVVGQDVIGDPKGDGLAGGRIQYLDAEGYPPFGAIFRRAFLLALAAHQGAKSFHRNLLISSGEAGNQGVFRGEHYITGAEHGVGPGGEHLDHLVAGLTGAIQHRKIEFGPG